MINNDIDFNELDKEIENFRKNTSVFYISNIDKIFLSTIIDDPSKNILIEKIIDACREKNENGKCNSAVKKILLHIAECQKNYNIFIEKEILYLIFKIGINLGKESIEMIYNFREIFPEDFENYINSLPENKRNLILNNEKHYISFYIKKAEEIKNSINDDLTILNKTFGEKDIDKITSIIKNTFFNLFPDDQYFFKGKFTNDFISFILDQTNKYISDSDQKSEILNSVIKSNFFKISLKNETIQNIFNSAIALGNKTGKVMYNLRETYKNNFNQIFSKLNNETSIKISTAINEYLLEEQKRLEKEKDLADKKEFGPIIPISYAFRNNDEEIKISVESFMKYIFENISYIELDENLLKLFRDFDNSKTNLNKEIIQKNIVNYILNNCSELISDIFIKAFSFNYVCQNDCTLSFNKLLLEKTGFDTRFFRDSLKEVVLNIEKIIANGISGIVKPEVGKAEKFFKFTEVSTLDPLIIKIFDEEDSLNKNKKMSNIIKYLDLSNYEEKEKAINSFSRIINNKFTEKEKYDFADFLNEYFPLEKRLIKNKTVLNCLTKSNFGDKLYNTFEKRIILRKQNQNLNTEQILH